ncbi:MAG: molybdopterin-dependent oxidoreductase [Candidatus Eremiobacteraeota bacterium]|nr:molybdopterin-dependent oxidoreductase [Candidatus Eremiobacteraeota bacterium]
MKRRIFLAGSLSSVIAGCSPIGKALNDNAQFHRLLGVAEPLNHALIGTRGMAKLYPESAIDKDFRLNGFDTPSDDAYRRLQREGYRSYRLVVDGAVQKPQAFTLPRLRSMQMQTQITRHDCVEGWSAIGKWSGVSVASILAAVKPKDNARYVVFYCMDRSPDGMPYYESLSLQQAQHPQTLLALDLNGKPLDPNHGAPVRMRIPTQLGYKSAKWIARIQVVASFANIFAGNGGYWEDQGYEWYAGI